MWDVPFLKQWPHVTKQLPNMTRSIEKNYQRPYQRKIDVYYLIIFVLSWKPVYMKNSDNSSECNQLLVVIQFLSGVVPLTEMAGFTPFLLQLLALRPSTCLVSGYPPSSNQSSLSPLPLASSRSSSVDLAFSCHSLQDSEQLSKHYRHPSSAHVRTI